MIGTISFLIALVVGSLFTASMIGFGVQWAASEFELGPIPRAFIGGFFIITTVLATAIDLDIVRAIPILLFIFYLGTFQIGTRIGHVVGMQAPDDNDPPEIFFELFNRYQ
ncbi:hypothetical protein [Halosimplex pelagicum]|jgi:hypothetical protein|uniref:Uncharacterized protein n=1 Tax=Halosimplex pelagicum TaxID=869886 RepID=A0A7D5P9H8_9EURY|nr:hypothetical protein [Halosimplex pelagicum]QLH82144.1 hypothetical protein HZS54_11245 [Halosimplex pelagicum]